MSLNIVITSNHIQNIKMTKVFKYINTKIAARLDSFTADLTCNQIYGTDAFLLPNVNNFS
jgi:hypothetical protein